MEGLQLVSANKTITTLPSAMCTLIDFAPSGILEVECATSPSPDDHHDDFVNCIVCPRQGKFFSEEEGIDDHSAIGHYVTFITGIFVILCGLCGAFLSGLILLVLSRRKFRKSFDVLLIALAYFDLVSSLMAAIMASCLMIWLENYSRNLVTLSAYLFCFLAVMFAKSGSSYITVAITVERYLAIAYPFTSRAWLTPSRAKLVALLTMMFSLGMSIPRSSSMYIGRNRVGGGVASTSQLNYLIYSSRFYDFWYGTLKGASDAVDLLMPLPILIIFNGILFYNIRKLSAKRQQLSHSQRKELQAVKVVAPVVLVLFLTYLIPLWYYYYLSHHGIIYREGVMALLLCAVLNAGTNFPIYYLKDPGFKEETKGLLATVFPLRTIWKPSREDDIAGTTTRVPCWYDE